MAAPWRRGLLNIFNKDFPPGVPSHAGRIHGRE
jgi:hypothetical protein